ncbi:glycogen/starch/alpha-glucan phosphorylase [Weissella confusa]|uniref:Alpha-1,4 glucan phosphorylase n=1 Tax=Weissella confusa TaxID=1583 RepID=A0A923SNU3_WEICO|nr:glycogen/starch/alpha-glucan phosphorylase [Weissella confusa]
MNGYQVEYPDDWLKNDNIWEVRQDSEAQVVHYGGSVRDTGAKQVYYFSIEFLPGRYLRANLLNLGLLTEAEEVMQDLGVDFNALLEAEVDQGLGNGGLGRLADYKDY